MRTPSAKQKAKELDSLLVLMQDSDRRTRELVSGRLWELGWTAIDYCLCNLERLIPEREQRRVLSALCGVSSVYASRQAHELLKYGPSAFFLPEGLYYLTRIVDPEYLQTDFRVTCGKLGSPLMSELKDGMTAVEKVEMLNYYVFDKYGFTLTEDTWDAHEAIVLLPDVIDSRKAGVVGISTVYFLLARYAGLPVYPVFPKVPGYYVAYFDGGKTLFSMDLVNRGRIADPVPRKSWLDTDLMGTDQTIMYLYATALRRFGEPVTRLQAGLLDGLLDELQL